MPGIERIDDGDDLFRRILPGMLILPNGRVSSAAFQRRGKPDQNISVDLARLISAEATAARARARDGSPIPGCGVVALTAGHPRSLGFEVVHRPSRDNYAHCQIEGRNTMELCEKLARGCRVVIHPDPASSQ